MRFACEAAEGPTTIRSYDPGRIVLRSRALTRSAVLLPDRVLDDWPPQQFDELAAEHFAWVETYHPEVLLIGCGGRQRLLPVSLMREFIRLGVAVECMTTAAACRTYNILLGEGRPVAAALLMIEAD